MAMQDSPSAFSACDRVASGSASFLLLVARVIFGFLFLQAGYYKLMGIAGTTGYLTNLKVPAPDIMSWIVGLFELLSGTALILGLATRYVSLASLTSAAAFFIAAIVLGSEWPVVAFAALAFGFVTYRHRGNIARLRAGTEPRARLRRPTSEPGS